MGSLSFVHFEHFVLPIYSPSHGSYEEGHEVLRPHGHGGLQLCRGVHGLKAKDVKAVIEGVIEVAAGELKRNGSFKLAGALNMKLKKKPAQPARKGVNPFTKEPCVFKAKPASKTVRALPMKKLKEMVN